MKIVHINKFFSPVGGAENIMLQEAVLLRRKGHEVHFFATKRQPYFEPDYPYTHLFSEYTSYDGISPAKVLKNIPKILEDSQSEKNLARLLDEVKPDLVHCHEFFYNLTPSFLRACYKRKIPVVMTLHTARLICPAGTLMRHDDTYCEDTPCATGNPTACLTNRCVSQSLPKSAIFALEYAYRDHQDLLKDVRYFISPSQALLDVSLRSGMEKEKFVLVNNFASPIYFEPLPEDAAPRDYFLYVGRLAKDKGVHYFLQALAKLPRDTKVRIVGTGPDEAYLKSLKEQLGLGQVEFVGPKRGEELKKEYRGAIASVLPCNWFENHPTVIMEAFASGVPVVASRIGGIPEMIVPGEHGDLFEPANVEEFATALSRLIENPALTAEMSQKVRRRAEEKYTEDLHLRRLMDVYERALQTSLN